MHCPNCDCIGIKGTIKVLKTRRDTIESIIRNRECQKCKHRWWTVEVELPSRAIKWLYDSDPNTDDCNCYPTRKKGARNVKVTFS
jgi:hypothetical protein